MSKFIVRCTCEHKMVVDADSVEDAIRCAEYSGFPDRYADETIQSRLEAVDVGPGKCEVCGAPLPDFDDIGESRCVACGALHSDGPVELA